MKNFTFILIISMAFASCNKHVVSKIEYRPSTNTTIYMDKDGRSIDSDPFAKEGSKIMVKVINDNPLANDITITQGDPVLFYMSEKPELLMTFLNPGKSDDAKNSAVSGTPNSHDKKNLTDTIQQFKLFYNSLISLNYLIEDFKYSKKINDNCICLSLQDIIKDLKAHFFDEERIKNIFNHCPEKDTICDDALLAEMVIDQAKKYKDYFAKQPEALALKIIDTANKDHEAILALIKEVSGINNAFNDKYMNEIMGVVEKYKLLYDLKYEENIGPFIPEETDILKLNVTINNKVKSKTITQVINLPVCKAMKIDFSTGVFATGLLDEDYKINKNQADTSYSFAIYNPNNLGYGTIGFVNFHPSLAGLPGFSVGGSIGAGLMFNNSAKFVLSPTVSFFFGKYQRLVIHGGIAIGQVDRISAIYSEGESYDDADYKPEIKQEVNLSWLVGATWNISRK
ncbi:MAG: hypothetical protein JWO09_972 [Bacteroidetes bacterium]|nr:hypothetical protein [Bacteroidota bacterium]